MNRSKVANIFVSSLKALIGAALKLLGILISFTFKAVGTIFCKLGETIEKVILKNA